MTPDNRKLVEEITNEIVETVSKRLNLRVDENFAHKENVTSPIWHEMKRMIKKNSDAIASTEKKLDVFITEMKPVSDTYRYTKGTSKLWLWIVGFFSGVATLIYSTKYIINSLFK